MWICDLLISPSFNALLVQCSKVIRLTDGEFMIKGPMLTGTTVRLGPAAILEIPGEKGGSVQVITTTIAVGERGSNCNSS